MVWIDPTAGSSINYINPSTLSSSSDSWKCALFNFGGTIAGATTSFFLERAAAKRAAADTTAAVDATMNQQLGMLTAKLTSLQTEYNSKKIDADAIDKDQLTKNNEVLEKEIDGLNQDAQKNTKSSFPEYSAKLAQIEKAKNTKLAVTPLVNQLKVANDSLKEFLATGDPITNLMGYTGTVEIPHKVDEKTDPATFLAKFTFIQSDKKGNLVEEAPYKNAALKTIKDAITNVVGQRKSHELAITNLQNSIVNKCKDIGVTVAPNEAGAAEGMIDAEVTRLQTEADAAGKQEFEVGEGDNKKTTTFAQIQKSIDDKKAAIDINTKQIQKKEKLTTELTQLEAQIKAVEEEKKSLELVMATPEITAAQSQLDSASENRNIAKGVRTAEYKRNGFFRSWFSNKGDQKLARQNYRTANSQYKYAQSALDAARTAETEQRLAWLREHKVPGYTD